MSDPTLHRQAARFLVVGGLNVAVSYGMFIALGLLVEPWLAYTAGYLAGLVVVALMTPGFVFGARPSRGRLVAFVTVYAVVYLAGRLVVAIIAPSGLAELFLTSAILLAVTVPLSFLAGRTLFGDRRRRSREVE